MAEIKQICRLKPARGAGFVATTQRDAEIVVGVAYYVRETQEPEPTAELGILVEDQFQGKGIGRSLWQQMQQDALTNAIHRLRVLFHPNNQRLVRLVRGGGFAYQAKRDGELSEYLIALGERARPAQTSGQASSTSDASSENSQSQLIGQWCIEQNRLHRVWTLVP